MAEQNVGAEAGPSRSPIVMNVIRPVVMDIGMMNYAVLRVYSDVTQQDWINIVRGYRRPEWTKDQITTPQELSDGTDDFVTLRIDCELRPLGLPYTVIGWGKLHHNPRDRLVTFFEEEDNLDDGYNGHSEQCFLARELIKTWKVHSQYSTHHVLLNEVQPLAPFTN